MKAKQADRTIRERFWWTDTDEFDYIIKLNIYLHCESGHYCYKCEEFHRGNTWLECEHREESWKQILEATNSTDVEEVKLFFKSNNAEWTKLNKQTQDTVKRATKEIITLKQTATEN